MNTGDEETAGGQGTPSEPSLHRVMGPWLLLFFIVGDVLGTGIYALTGKIANHVGGVVWLPFVMAFAVALLTAFSYLELVTKYPRAAGAALYTHQAFGFHFLTFLVAFAVMCSGITSAATAARAFAANFMDAFALGSLGSAGVTFVGLAFLIAVAVVNYRSASESVKTNVVLTCVEMSGLLIVIAVGFSAIAMGKGDLGRVLEYKAGDGGLLWGAIAGTTLAFFAMIGFEDAVNMAEETKDPSRIFPRVLFAGLSLSVLIYILVSISAVALVPPAGLGEGETPLLKVVEAGAPGFPLQIFGIITMFAVANSALINMLMASRLLYGMSRERILPPVFGKVHSRRRTPYVAIVFTTLLACTLLAVVGEVPALGGTTALLLLCVFTVVNAAVLVLRRDKVAHQHFRAPAFVPFLGAATCAFFAGPWTGRAPVQYEIAGVLTGIGILLWLVAYAVNLAAGERPAAPAMEDLSGDPHN